MVIDFGVQGEDGFFEVVRNEDGTIERVNIDLRLTFLEVIESARMLLNQVEYALFSLTMSPKVACNCGCSCMDENYPPKAGFLYSVSA